MGDTKSFTTPGGFSVNAEKADIGGSYYGNTYQPGQWLVEEEKETDGVKVYSHYVADAPDAGWSEFGTGLDAELPPMPLGAAATKVYGELDQRSEAELVDLAALYELEGKPGMGLKEGLIEAIQEYLEGVVPEGGSPTAVIRSALYGQEGYDLPPNSSSTDPNPRSEEAGHIHAATVAIDAARTPEGLVFDGPAADDSAEGDADSPRPALSATKADWVAYRTAQGYTEDSLEGYTKDDLIGLG